MQVKHRGTANNELSDVATCCVARKVISRLLVTAAVHLLY